MKCCETSQCPRHAAWADVRAAWKASKGVSVTLLALEAIAKVAPR